MLVDELKSAVFSNDYNRIERWGDYDEYFNVANFDLTTPLHWVAQSGNYGLAHLLLKHGAPLEEKCKEYQATPLIYAVNNNSLRTVKELIDLGADINAVDKDGNNGLHYAVVNDNEEIAAFLLDSGINSSQRSIEGLTPEALARSLGRRIYNFLQNYNPNSNFNSSQENQSLSICVFTIGMSRNEVRAILGDPNISSQSMNVDDIMEYFEKGLKFLFKGNALQRVTLYSGRPEIYGGTKFKKHECPSCIINMDSKFDDIITKFGEPDKISENSSYKIKYVSLDYKNRQFYLNKETGLIMFYSIFVSREEL